MMKKSFLLLIALSFSFFLLKAQMIEHMYNFNGLTDGELNGKDGWTTVKNLNDDGQITCKDIYIGYGSKTSPDLSKNAYYPCGGPNVGRTAWRITTPELPFKFTSGGIMEIQVDIHTAWWGTFFGFGYDANNNGYIVPGIEQTAAYENNEGGIGIFLTEKPQTAQNICFMKPDGSKITFKYDSIVGWNIFKMVLDLDANSEAGSLSLFAKRSNGSFVAVPEVQNINLGLVPGAGNKLDPAKWTKLFIQSTGSYGAFDNIIIRQPNVPDGMQYQYITFPAIGNHLTTDAPFQLNAFSNKGLPITYEIVSGPATVNGNILTLNGTPGVVKVVASQSGTAVIMAAANDTAFFDVINPHAVFPEVEIKSPIANSAAFSPNLDKIMIYADVKIMHNDVLEISEVQMIIDGSEPVAAFKSSNGYYVAYVDVATTGAHTAKVTAYSSGGTNTEAMVDFNLVNSAPTRTETIIQDALFGKYPSDGLVCKLDTIINLPAFSGTYSRIMAYLNYGCSTDGCDLWDKITKARIRGANGEYIELLRYITPYNKACSDSVDITDLASQLQGKINLIAEFPAKSVITIKLVFEEGTPSYKYTWVYPLWQNSYLFGKYINATTAAQEVEQRYVNLGFFGLTKIDKAILRLTSSGHGWGENNTDNAAEFKESTHHIQVNDANVFEQKLWRVCSPNPTGCNPQAGTWYHNRAGWCPGSIPMLWHFDLASHIGQTVKLSYIFDPSYIDFCSSFNPNCNSTTCQNCNDTYNPHIIVDGSLIFSFNESPIAAVSNEDPYGIHVFPNPANDMLTITASKLFKSQIQIFDLSGKIVKELSWDGIKLQVDVSSFKHGVYFLKVSGYNGVEYKKIIVQ